MNGLATRNRFLPYLLAFFGSLCIMILELVASRLVARHVGASLNVWTSVIGIMLGGICLGNVLGGRLADRSDPSRVIGPLYGLGSALTLACLWINSIGAYIPEEGVPNWFRTVALVSIDFLIPGTILGMIGPVVAKIAVEQARKAGSAIGDVYFLGAVGSIFGTFLAGYFLMYYAPTTTIITLVAAGLALMATFLFIGDRIGFVLGCLTTTLLVVSAFPPLVQLVPIKGVLVGGITINPIALAGHVAALGLALVGLVRLIQSKLPPEVSEEELVMGEKPPRPKLSDLAMLSFVISLAFMSFEMAAGRLVSRHLGSSIYGWTSIIGVLLGGLSLGNFLGGKIADKVKEEKEASWLFLIASVLLLTVLLMESPPRWLVSNPIEYFFQGKPRDALFKGGGSILSSAITMSGVPWGLRLFFVISVAFFLPSVALGTVSPVMAKLAVDRVKRTKRTGGAIGVVYAWGMVGSILGTFLTGFLLIDVLGTKGVLILLATILALAATVIGTTWHAIWAGIPLGLCIIAFLPVTKLNVLATDLGIREIKGDPSTEKEDGVAWIDESNYYFIKVENSIFQTQVFDLKLMPSVADAKEIPSKGESLVIVASVKDVLHFRIFDGYGEQVVDTDEKVLEGKSAEALAARIQKAELIVKKADKDAAEEEARTFFAREARARSRLRDGVQSAWPPKEIDKTEAGDLISQVLKVVGHQVNQRTLVLDNLIHGYFILGHPMQLDYDYEHIYALVADRVAKAKAKAGKDPKAVDATALKTMFLGGGAYTFQRYILKKYPGSLAEVAEIDPSVTETNFRALGLPRNTPIVTHWGDARQFVERNQNKKQFDIIFGDAFNDFSVPWHLTTREFNDKLSRMLEPDGVYMINIIDVYESDLIADGKAMTAFDQLSNPKPGTIESLKEKQKREALNFGGFLGSWVKTARLTFPNIYVFGTDNKPGSGVRETFVVVASKTPLDIDILGGREDDPKFFTKSGTPVKPIPFDKLHMDELEVRSRGIVLTDDYAPVENLLAPVAATRGDE